MVLNTTITIQGHASQQTFPPTWAFQKRHAIPHYRVVQGQRYPMEKRERKLLDLEKENNPEFWN